MAILAILATIHQAGVAAHEWPISMVKGSEIQPYSLRHDNKESPVLTQATGDRAASDRWLLRV